MKHISRRDFCIASSALCASVLTSSALALNRAGAHVKTGYAFDDDFVSFENNFAETYHRAEWINSRLVLTGVRSDLELIVPYPDPMEYIRKIHTQEHIDSIDKVSAIDPFTLTIGQVARTAVGHALGAVKAVCDGTVRNAFCCIRPPGHHVLNTGELGYCCYANVVLAAKYAREKYNIKKILLIDWDYHQGNGTHSFICGDEDILFFETYSPTMYQTKCNDFIITGPNHSFPDDSRRINIRMPSASTNDDFVRIFESKLVPAAERFKPELVLISCGFDLKKYDTHGSFLVTANGISRLTRIVRQIADTYAGGKLVSLLEGGYADSLRDETVYGVESTFSGLSQCAENHIKTLITGDEYPETPFYTATKTIRKYTPKNRHYVNRGFLGGFPGDDGPWSIIVAKSNGRVVKKVVDQENFPLNIAELNLPTGQYIISVTGKSGSAYRSVKVVR